MAVLPKYATKQTHAAVNPRGLVEEGESERPCQERGHERGRQIDKRKRGKKGVRDKEERNGK